MKKFFREMKRSSEGESSRSSRHVFDPARRQTNIQENKDRMEGNNRLNEFKNTFKAAIAEKDEKAYILCNM